MTSKQEKLAAARRKLKEFQGKNKGEISKQKNSSDPLATMISKDCFHSSDSVIYSNHFISDIESSKNSLVSTYPCHVTQSADGKTTEDSVKARKVSESSPNGSNFLKLESEHYQPDENLRKEKSVNVQGEEKADCNNGLRTNYTETYNIAGKNDFDINMSKGSSILISERNHGTEENTFSPIETMKMKTMETKKFLDDSKNNKSFLADVIKPLQMELQNHAHTITILIQQRNDAQTALLDTQQLLNKKLEEIEELKQVVSRLNSSTNNLSQKLFDAEDVIMKLKLEKEDNLQTQDKIKLVADNFKIQVDNKEEELQEMKKKYKEKSSHCEQLLFSLNEVQSQLSLCQIQLQQYSAEGHSDLAIQVSVLQNENHNLKEKITKLEKQLEVEVSEKEEAGQKFHIYAQQCNSQLSSLNSQLKTLKLDNESLSQENNTLSKYISELESAKDKTENSPHTFENEIADLHNQLSAVLEKNNQLQNNLQEKEKESTFLENQLSEKNSELNLLLRTIEELEQEKKKLLNEVETPKANERLLATMESDKVAAAKAVSQNQKLKEQIVELEKAFMKLSEEKLELTNQLAHEKHMNAEIQNLLKSAESKHCDHDSYHHHNECRQDIEKPEPLVNDSNEIEELRSIVRQLQDDKMELKGRLSSYESNKNNSNKESEEIKKEKCEHEHEYEHENEHEEIECENTKLLLQQMEEKVRKTMNEIAVLDEEKEKLEHLVLQLQGETETIGEYITLYQKQRMLLRQRAQEKDIQLLQLAKDKEELKSKLITLDELIQHLISERENMDVQSGSKLSTINSSVNALENTAGKIRALINDIGTTTLINSHSIAFEHCSCCSGRLITI